MDITLNISYTTKFGEELSVNILNKKITSSHRMTTFDGKVWTCKLKVNIKNEPLEYYYSVVYADGKTLRSEWREQMHRVEISATFKEITLFDRWMDIPKEAHLYSSAFTQCINKRSITQGEKNNFSRAIQLKVRAPQLSKNQRLRLVGEEDVLGAWNPLKALTMYEHNFNEWIAQINTEELFGKKITFKFIITSNDETEEVIWEEGPNRSIEIPNIKEGNLVVLELSPALFSISDIKCAGTLVPVFSLRSKKSFGVGDFGDLKKMIDWVALTGQRVLQILPINDTTSTGTWNDSYPYNPTSVFALHPQYASFESLPKIANPKERKRFESLRQRLNKLEFLDYEKVNNAKNQYLKILFSQEGQNMMASKEFKAFFESNSSWLVPYAQYCFFREKFNTADFSLWTGHKNFKEKDRKILSNPLNPQYKEVAYFYFVQFILYSQMKEVHEYARSKGVILKGDVPIGVNRLSCEVWQKPHYFNIKYQTGAPPDDFATKGQNWGFPTYNWQEMEKDDFLWWRNRLSNMAKFFDAYRIDHVLGFFRIWEIPIDAVDGLLGQFSSSLGLTKTEIEACGLTFKENLFLEPFITDEVLEEVFEDMASQVRDSYLEKIDNLRYRLKKEYATQRKVKQAFHGDVSPSAIKLKEGLYTLISDVLFVRDHRDNSKFHPRISAKSSFIYKSLSESDKALFCEIYNDYFYHRNNHFWYLRAMSKLPRITQSTRMLTCAEDLGMIPECVPWVMNELKMLSLEMQSMPKALGLKFGILSCNPYLSVCMISSHDTPTLRGWWDEDEERTQSYYNSSLHKYGYAPHPLPGWLAKEIIVKHLACPSMLCVIAIQDWMAIDENIRCKDPNIERVNIPANPHHYWRYRMHIPLEDIIENKLFCQTIKSLIQENKRT